MDDVEIIEDPAAAMVALDPIRSRLLAELKEPASAATLAARLGLARQKVNYHLRALEAHGLVSVSGARRWGGLTEQLYSARAASYVVSPAALGPAAIDPSHAPDRMSAAFLIALAARAVQEVGDLCRRAILANKRLATLSIDAEVRFASAADRAAFTADLTTAIGAVVARYHEAAAAGGRSHRLVVMAYPTGSRQPRKEHA